MICGSSSGEERAMKQGQMSTMGVDKGEMYHLTSRTCNVTHAGCVTGMRFSDVLLSIRGFHTRFAKFPGIIP